MGKQLVALKYHPDFLPKPGKIFAVPVDGFPIQCDFAALNLLQGVDTSKQRTLSAAAWADDHNDFSFMYCEIQVIQNHIPVKLFFQMFNSQQFL